LSSLAVIFFYFGSVPTSYNFYKLSCFSKKKTVRANQIYLEKLQNTWYWKNRLNNLGFYTIENFRQYHCHVVAKYENISSKENINIKEFRPK